MRSGKLLPAILPWRYQPEFSTRTTISTIPLNSIILLFLEDEEDENRLIMSA
jgi:hypothetical protein